MSLIHSSLISIATVVAVVVPALPALADPALRLRGERVHEELRSDALINGNWLVGAHTAAPRNAEGPRLYSYIPGGADWQGQTLCARATDKEGRYSALFEYHVPVAWGGGLVDLEYETEYEAFVSASDESNNGIALHRGDCRLVTDDFLPVLWNAAETPETDGEGRMTLILNLNAGRADSLIPHAVLSPLDGAAGGDMPIRCDPTSEAGVGFNYQCRIQVPADQAGVLTVGITRLRYGKAAPPRMANIHLYTPEIP
ncbi:hypothetical protein [Primorskyibacter flagellatus]|uniref:hypothetical protein n=1 Tax=Primorskyibacter flagellatus TaxID=1387277 RepID=UPI003A91A512